MDSLHSLSDALEHWSQTLSLVLSAPTPDNVEKHTTRIENLQTVCDLLYAELCEMEQALPEREVEVGKIRDIARKISPE